MEIPIITGVYTDTGSDFRTSYPVNMCVVPKSTGISMAYLKLFDGIIKQSDTNGIDRGGIAWRGVCYRVIGSNLVKIDEDGVITVLGDVGAGGLVSMTYSFDRLAIASGGKLFYYSTGIGVVEVTDPDLGKVLDVQWIDGYFMTTDGESLVITELTDPTQINPLKYGSSEVDPDDIVCLLKIRNEIFALNRYSIEGFDNIGSEFFPFQRRDSAHIQKGCVGTHAACVFFDMIAFVGSGRNEPLAVYIGDNASTVKISTREIDLLLNEFDESVLSTVKMESRMDGAHMQLYVHLPNKTLVYDASASKEVQLPVWFILSSSIIGLNQFKARNFVWCYNKWLVSDPTQGRIGYFSKDVGEHWEEKIAWEFGTTIIYNEGLGVLVKDIELIALPGRTALGANPVISLAYSDDGLTWSQERYIKTGTQGNRSIRLIWFNQGLMRHWRIQRFRGTSDARLAIARLEIRFEPLRF